MNRIKVGSDFSGVGAFSQALMRLGIDYDEVFACDMDKYARQTFIDNYGEPKYYPTNVYEREIPSESLDIYMTSPPCQAFSLAGKRLGKDDKRGILFFNSLEFIQVNKPRYFIFENVKGLLSDDNGKTFNEWVNLLGGKSVNGLPVLFAYEDSVPYHLYWKVLNAKEHGVPQNRERVFLIGIRDDKDNNFRFPIEEHLTKRLKDILEINVDKKYNMTEKGIFYILEKIGTYTGINEPIVRCITTRYSASISGTFLNINNIYRKLTPRECFRLMDFPDSFIWTCSDSQAYKQAGNSIVINVLYKILKNLNL
jgi:DNA (cytosine-5)-methyltransferase 1